MKKLKIKKKNRSNDGDLKALQAIITKLFKHNEEDNDSDTEEETDEDELHELEHSVEHFNEVTDKEEALKNKDYLERNQSILQSNMDVSHFPTLPPGTPTTYEDTNVEYNNRLVLDPNVVSFHPMNGPMRTFSEHLRPRLYKRNATQNETPRSSELLKQLQPTEAAKEQPARVQAVHSNEDFPGMIRNFTDPLLTKINKLEQHAIDQFTK
jgi:hypothetical protein